MDDTHIPAKRIEFEFDGAVVPAYEGQSVAAALMAAGIRVLRHIPQSGEYRGLYCGMGICFDCLMIIDGVPDTRSCMVVVQEGMRVETQVGLGGVNYELP
jgi:D-hydroxyproline dehydrogenase subunit gamma